jgi:pimeloyl-ACP methyl ester carboxylesterase
MHNKITEGYMPFMGYLTYYRIVGEATGKAPLLLLHGGPGSTHILGQSWGAMLAIAYVIDHKPQGVKSLILSSGHASSSLYPSEPVASVPPLPSHVLYRCPRGVLSGAHPLAGRK